MKATYTILFRVEHTEDDNPDMPSLNPNALAAHMAEMVMGQSDEGLVITPLTTRLVSVEP